MATMPSPPGRFSTTTGWFQTFGRRSASSRMPISVPLPGPSVRISLTGRCGQLCAYPGAAANTLTASNVPAATAQVRQEPQIIGAPANQN